MTDSALRSRARRLGFRLHRSRAERGLDNLGGYMLTDATTGWLVAGERFDLEAEQVAVILGCD